MKAFIDEHRERFGVEPICQQLQVAPSAYRRHAARQRNPELRCARAQRDEILVSEIERVWQVNLQVYGADKVWRQLNREGIAVARCTVGLMRRQGLRGAMRGKPVKTTRPDPAAPCPLDHVNRQFSATRPNQLWVADFTYVSTWQGFVYVAFVIDVYARYIVGWRVSRSMHTDFVLDAMEQALYARQPDRNTLIHHSDRAVCFDSLFGTSWGSRYRALRRQQGRQLRQCARRDHQRPLQGGNHSPTRPLEVQGGRRAGNAPMGLVVQSSSIA